MSKVVKNEIEIITSSLDVALIFGKEHFNVLHGIQQILKKHPQLKSEFIISSYIDSQNKSRTKYDITQKGSEILSYKYKYGIATGSLETSMYRILRTLFPNEIIECQKPVLNYKVDFYLDFASLIIEYDGGYHKSAKQKALDKKRMKEIRQELMRVILEDEANEHLRGKDVLELVRVEEGKEIEGIRQIMIAVEEQTWNSPVAFMRTKNEINNY